VRLRKRGGRKEGVEEKEGMVRESHGGGSLLSFVQLKERAGAGFLEVSRKQNKFLKIETRGKGWKTWPGGGEEGVLWWGG